MRQLRVVGLGDDTSTVILEDPVRHERFVVASDERLRAAARGDVRRLGQMEIEISSPLRPRDIQARVRAGESVDDVAATAGVSAAHVERFAYPVLLERARVSELARRAHPLRNERPDPRALGEIVAGVLAGRGQDYDDARWDAWKGDDGRWTVALAWRAGHSEHVAHWAFQPGPSGGTVEPRDDAAHDVSGEPPSGPRRSDGQAGRSRSRTDDPTLEPDAADAAGEDDLDLEMPAALVANGESLRPAPAPPAKGAATAAAPSAPAARPESAEAASPGSRRPAERRPRGVPDQRDQRGADPRPAASRRGRPSPSSSTPSSSTPSSSESEGGSESDDAERAPGSRRRPIVPSWEDVLLGVRSPKS